MAALSLLSLICLDHSNGAFAMMDAAALERLEEVGAPNPRTIAEPPTIANIPYPRSPIAEAVPVAGGREDETWQIAQKEEVLTAEHAPGERTGAGLEVHEGLPTAAAARAEPLSAKLVSSGRAELCIQILGAAIVTGVIGLGTFGLFDRYEIERKRQDKSRRRGNLSCEKVKTGRGVRTVCHRKIGR